VWQNIAIMTPFEPLPNPLGFRQALYACFSRRQDALFELTDAILTAGPVPSLAHCSLAAAHRRGWGRLYASLAHGQVEDQAVQTLLVRHAPPDPQLVFAVDVSVWPRCDAATSPDRGYYYHPARHSAGKPIVAGWAYQWIAQLSFTRDSWTAPLEVRRLHPSENANPVAVQQVQAVLCRLPPDPDRAIPLFVFDAGYDAVQLSLGLADAKVAVLVRLRSDRCFYADPPAVGATTGRPRRHGAKFACKDPTTWPTPTGELAVEDDQYGAVRVRAWAGLHGVPQAHATRGSRQPRPLVRGTVLLVEVTRLPGRTQRPQQLWLWWYGPGTPDLDRLWRAYVRRFDLEHTFRFLKQTLGWTTPRLRHPEQADRWTWLIVAAYTQLRLLRGWVSDQRLPWQRPLPAQHLTPGRVRQGLLPFLPALGSPASEPKPCGRSPGRPKGRRSGKAQRHPVIKKAA
jgi:hypothetical protein